MSFSPPGGISVQTDPWETWIVPTAICQHLTRLTLAVILSSEWPLLSVFLSAFYTFLLSCLFPASISAVGVPLLDSEHLSCRFHKLPGTAVPPHVSAYVMVSQQSLCNECHSQLCLLPSVCFCFLICVTMCIYLLQGLLKFWGFF